MIPHSSIILCINSNHFCILPKSSQRAHWWLYFCEKHVLRISWHCMKFWTQLISTVEEGFDALQLANSKSVIFHTVVDLREAPHLFIMKIHWRSIFSSVSVNLHFIQLTDTHCLILFNQFCKVLWEMSYDNAAFHMKVVWLFWTAWIANSSLPSCLESFGIELGEKYML